MLRTCPPRVYDESVAVVLAAVSAAAEAAEAARDVALVVRASAAAGIGEITGSAAVPTYPSDAIFAKKRGIEAIEGARKPWAGFNAAVTTLAEAVAGRADEDDATEDSILRDRSGFVGVAVTVAVVRGGVRDRR